MGREPMTSGRAAELDLAVVIGEVRELAPRLEAVEQRVESVDANVAELHEWLRMQLMQGVRRPHRPRTAKTTAITSVQWSAYAYTGASLLIRLVVALRPELRGPLQPLLDLLSGS